MRKDRGHRGKQATIHHCIELRNINTALLTCTLLCCMFWEAGPLVEETISMLLALNTLDHFRFTRSLSTRSHSIDRLVEIIVRRSCSNTPSGLSASAPNQGEQQISHTFRYRRAIERRSVLRGKFVVECFWTDRSRTSSCWTSSAGLPGT